MKTILNQINRFSSLFIFILVLTVYAPALHGEFIWDDDLHVIHIEKLKSFDGLKQI